MSTLIAVKRGDVVALGSDSRWMSTDRLSVRSDSTPKLIQIRPDLFMGLTGMVETCKRQVANAYELAPHFPKLADFARVLHAVCLPWFEDFARTLSRPDHISGEQPFAAFLLAGHGDGRQPEWIYCEYYRRNGHVECEARSSFNQAHCYMVTAGEQIAPELNADNAAGRLATEDPVSFVRRVLRRQHELRPFVGGADQVLVIDRDGARWVVEPPVFRLDWWPWADSTPKEGHLDISKAFGFHGAEFEVDPTQGFRVKNVDFTKGLNSITLDGSEVPKIVIAPDGVALGWIGKDAGSGYAGAWFKRVLVGGTAPANAPFFADASGNVVANGIYVNSAGSPLGWIGSNAGLTGAWFKKLYVGGSAPANAPIVADASGNVSINGATFSLVKENVTTELMNSTSPTWGIVGLKIAAEVNFKSVMSYDKLVFTSPDDTKLWAKITAFSGGRLSLGDENGTADSVVLDGYSTSRGLYVGGNKVVGPRQFTPSTTGRTAGASYTANEQSMINELKAAVNDIITKLGSASGHGLWT